MKPLVRSEDGKVVCAENDKGDILISKFDIGRNTIRRIAEICGVDFYAPGECTVYADSRFVSFFPKNDVEFVPESMQEGEYFNFLTGERYVPGTALKISGKLGAAFIKKQ